MPDTSTPAFDFLHFRYILKWYKNRPALLSDVTKDL